MNKAYWIRIQSNYPHALQKAIDHFKSRSPGIADGPLDTQWKTEFKDPDKLIQFFQEYDIDIIITKSRNRYGYELRANHTIVKVTAKYRERAPALWWSIDHAFYFLEQRYLGTGDRTPLLKASRGQRKKHNSGNWGEEARKKEQ